MSEVEKLYELAEPNRDCNLYKNYRECPMKHTQCEDCENFVYPPFTDEKQIKIIEWLGNSKAFFDANETIFSLITNYKDKNGVVKGYEGRGNSVDSCLASLINNLWQDLTEAEQNEIREILK